MTEHEREELRRRKSERDAQFVARHPVELQPLAEELIAFKNHAVQIITRKNRLQISGADSVELAKAIEQVEELKRQDRELQERLQEALVQYRVSALPEEKRQEGLDLLRAEQAAIEGAVQSSALDAGTFGAIGGKYFGLQRRYTSALESGDTKTAEELKPILEEAAADKTAVETASNKLRARIEELRAEYQRRFEALLKEG